jgi:hypothetical protein
MPGVRLLLPNAVRESRADLLCRRSHRTLQRLRADRPQAEKQRERRRRRPCTREPDQPIEEARLDVEIEHFPQALGRPGDRDQRAGHELHLERILAFDQPAGILQEVWIGGGEGFGEPAASDRGPPAARWCTPPPRPLLLHGTTSCG